MDEFAKKEEIKKRNKTSLDKMVAEAKQHEQRALAAKKYDGITKIRAYRGDRAACWFFRLHAPMSYLARYHKDRYWVAITSRLDKDRVGEEDLAILQRQYKADVFHPIMKAKKEKGMKVVYEIDDDLFNVPKWNPAYKILGQKTVQDNTKRFLENVDAVFTTTHQLKDTYKNYCKRIYVLPNSVDYDVLIPRPPSNSKRKVILWQGSHTHLKDVEIIRKTLEKLTKDDDVFVKLWRIDMGIKNTHLVPFVNFEDFYAMFSQLDGYIGLAPISAVQFNKGKSNLKFLDYTSHGMVTVASDFGEYANTIVDNATGLLANNPNEWYEKIRWLLNNEDEYNRILENAQKFVKENYDINKNYLLWKQAIDEVMSK